ncbi:MAG: B12-binding domain-containing radical SAM protein, partial [Holophaga sp.]|nr:B12-binding domain-containing radical SAM protein [Holophaga sp.]
KRAGMYAAELGTDAACDRTLRGIGKGFKFFDALEVNRAFVAERVPCAHFVMFGGPGETLETIEEGLANLELLENTVVFAFTGLRILPDTPLYTLAIQEGVLAKDAPLHEPAFYHSPQVDRAVMNAMIANSFQGRRDRFFPPETSQRVRTVMSRFGYKGLLWDSIIRFPKIPVLPST